MRVTINRKLCCCETGLCERCLGYFLHAHHIQPCFEVIEDDGCPDLTVEFHDKDGVTTLTLHESELALLEAEGWTTATDFYMPNHPKARDSKKRHGHT